MTPDGAQSPADRVPRSAMRRTMGRAGGQTSINAPRLMALVSSDRTIQRPCGAESVKLKRKP
ncbi:hypothetical protein XBFFL1_1040025 [Xenorhabdus bovienii str. feltiae Florida]|nr:hypothetical protein XBFFR1_970026 [Xenorhabdus bovienii str. feltiae France]CDG90693.1 hypothetical protein XBFFL1_1040025 [Xenorhabdus bovienii str. feltiae Florida]